MHDDRAATAPLAFVIAGALIIGVIATALMTTNDIATPTNTGSSVAANRQAQAQGLVSLMLTTPGYVGGTGDPWTGEIDDGKEPGTGGRIGLQHASLEALDLMKFRHLKSAPYASSDDPTGKYANYEETRQMFGLEAAGLDFHVRAYPTLASVQERLSQNEKDTTLRIAYIGNQIESGGTVPEVGSLSCDASPAGIDSNSVRYSIAVKNTGTVDTQFQVTLTIDNGGKRESIKDQSAGVAVNAWTTIDFDVPNTSKYQCLATTEVDVEVSDVSTSLVSRADEVPNNLGAPTDVQAEGTAIELNQMHYLSNEVVTVGFTADEGDVLEWRMLEDLTGTVELGRGFYTVPKKGATFNIDPADASQDWQIGWPNAWPLGTHRVVVENTAENTPDGATATQRLTAVAGPVGPYTPSGGTTTSFDPAVAIEVDFIHQLVEKFCPTYWDKSGNQPAGSPSPDSPLGYWGSGDENYAQQCSSYKANPTQPGDVFWDDKALLTDQVCDRLQQGTGCNPNADLPDLSETSVLVVGSNVDHNAMTSGNFKWPLRDWVHAGGTLIAFGSPDTTTNWLNPIFHVAEESSSGAVAAPDMAHPLLSVPNQLDFVDYDNQGLGWRYTGNADEHFADVVKQGDAPITAISDPGDLGLGTVMITSWLPYDPYGDGSAPMEGMALMHNFLIHSYRDLFLDYGPPIPQGEEAVPALGRSQICHSYDYDDWAALGAPGLEKLRLCEVEDGRGLGLIDMDIALFVFRG